MSQITSKFPVSTTSGAKVVSDDLKLDVVISRFSDRILVVLTSLAKPGALFEVKATASETQAPTITSENQGTRKSVYDVKQLLGEENPDLEVFARAIAELLAPSDPVGRPVLVSLGLHKSVTPQLFLREILPFVKAQSNL